MPAGQCITLSRVFNFSDASVGSHQPEGAPLFTALEESAPKFLQLRAKGGLGEVVQSAADYFVSGESKQLARSTTGVVILSVNVRDKDGFGWCVDNRPEQHSSCFMLLSDGRCVFCGWDCNKALLAKSCRQS